MKSGYNNKSLAKSTLLVVEKLHICEKVYFDQLLDVPNFQYFFYYSFTLYYCAIFNSFDAIIRVSNSLDPDQARYFFGPDLGPNCLQMLSADNKSRR